MAPKDFRKISHPEQKILNSLVNFTRKDRKMVLNLELTPPEGGSAKNSWISIKGEKKLIQPSEDIVDMCRKPMKFLTFSMFSLYKDVLIQLAV